MRKGKTRAARAAEWLNRGGEGDTADRGGTLAWPAQPEPLASMSARTM